MTITVIGTGFVGVVSAAVYAHYGQTVIGLDIDQNKINSLQKGKVPFFEPQLEELLIEQQKTGRLSFSTDYKEAISQSDLIIIAVGTPSAPDGQADLAYVFAATESLAPYLKEKAVVAIKSTVPPGTLQQVDSILKKITKTQYYLASMPEFLREGTAVADSLNPDRIVIGVTDDFVKKLLTNLHKPFNAPIIPVKPESAQMGKYTANAYLALRITFINQIADLCQKNGADISEVISVISQDQRIGAHYWYPGFGYGGSCFPKDVNELAAYSRSIGEENNLFNKLTQLNNDRIPLLMDHFSKKIGGWKNKTVAVLGLSFKPNTNDMREAPSIKVISQLIEQGARVKGYDPQAIPVADHFITPNPSISYVQSIDEAVENADIIMALIEWPEITTHTFKNVAKSKKKVWFIDARNQFDQEVMESAGYSYLAIGKKA